MSRKPPERTFFFCCAKVRLHETLVIVPSDLCLFKKRKRLSEWKGHSPKQLTEFRGFLEQLSELHSRPKPCEKQATQQFLERLPELVGNPFEEVFHLSPNSQSVFLESWGGPHTPDNKVWGQISCLPPILPSPYLFAEP